MSMAEIESPRARTRVAPAPAPVARDAREGAAATSTPNTPKSITELYPEYLAARRRALDAVRENNAVAARIAADLPLLPSDHDLAEAPAWRLIDWGKNGDVGESDPARCTYQRAIARHPLYKQYEQLCRAEMAAEKVEDALGIAVEKTKPRDYREIILKAQCYASSYGGNETEEHDEPGLNELNRRIAEMLLILELPPRPASPYDIDIDHLLARTGKWSDHDIAHAVDIAISYFGWWSMLPGLPDDKADDARSAEICRYYGDFTEAIHNSPAQGPVGAAAKLRIIVFDRDNGIAVDDDQVTAALKQMTDALVASSKPKASVRPPHPAPSIASPSTISRRPFAMSRKTALERSETAAHALIAKPTSTWTAADTTAAFGLLKKFDLHLEYRPETPFNELQNAMGAAPISSFPAALAKVRWITEQPAAEINERQAWEPAAYRTLRDFLSPTNDFVAELGLRTGQAIRRAEEAGEVFDGPACDAAISEMEAIDGLVEALVPTSLQGVITQMVVAMSHLENLKAMTFDGIVADDIRESIERAHGLLDRALPVLAVIAGVDLQSDLAADYRVSSVLRTVVRPPSPYDAEIEKLIAAAGTWSDFDMPKAIGLIRSFVDWSNKLPDDDDDTVDQITDLCMEYIGHLEKVLRVARVVGPAGAEAMAKYLKSEADSGTFPELLVSATANLEAYLASAPEAVKEAA
jgi:hypothetical protein